MKTTNFMEHKGFKAQVMEADRLTGDYVHSLPPGKPLPVYPIDMFINPPENWMKGPGVFIIPVRPDRGLWFNWTMNSDNNTAVIPTVKGCNPITGMQTSGFFMERYENKCPKHGCDFMHDRFCPECNYKWPPQNYVGPKNMLWWDGFLNCKDGTVRQFFFSEEELRDVAGYVVGPSKVPAFGFAFYSPKERRPDPCGVSISGSLYNAPNLLLGASTKCCSSSDVCYDSYEVKTSGGHLGKISYQFPVDQAPVAVNYCGSIETASETKSKQSFTRSFSKARSLSADIGRTELRCSSVQERRESVKEVSIGAGAKIDQKLNADPYELSSYKEAPDSVMTVYFVFQEKFDEIYSRGIRDLSGNKEGFLAEIPVG
jgi:hypothetical protein